MFSTAELQTPLGKVPQRALFSSGSTAPAAARRYVRDVLTKHEPDLTADRLEDVVLLTSELVTNGTRYGTEPGDSLLVVVTSTVEFVRLEVHDPVRRRPRHKPESSERVRGRGLFILDALSARWGVDDRPLGKVVWAEVPR